MKLDCQQLVLETSPLMQFVPAQLTISASRGFGEYLHTIGKGLTISRQARYATILKCAEASGTFRRACDS